MGMFARRAEFFVYALCGQSQRMLHLKGVVTMAEKRQRITEAGMAKLQEELDYRMSVVRTEIAAEIDEARRHGDLSENAEYTEAKKKQSENETEIARLQDAIKYSEVISEDEISTDTVSVGTSVTVLDLDRQRQMTYAIVGVQESNPLKGHISDESPVGSGLLGAAVGEERNIEIPSGAVKHYRILSISRQDQED